VSSQNIQTILDKTLAGERITTGECTTLLESYDIARIGAAADEIRQRRHPDNVVTYIIDRNVNYTNVCVAKCTFCAFRRDHEDADSYTLSYEQIGAKIRELVAIGAPSEVLTEPAIAHHYHAHVQVLSLNGSGRAVVPVRSHPPSTTDSGEARP